KDCYAPGIRRPGPRYLARCFRVGHEMEGYKIVKDDAGVKRWRRIPHVSKPKRRVSKPKRRVSKPKRRVSKPKVDVVKMEKHLDQMLVGLSDCQKKKHRKRKSGAPQLSATCFKMGAHVDGYKVVKHGKSRRWVPVKRQTQLVGG
ncbi:hypothetical protein OAM67_01405, partial [bacterium]|nr:hypothetical protein [bacterium]